MQRIIKSLKAKLKGARRIAVLGVGSEIRGDDASGIFAARKINSGIKKLKLKSSKVFLGMSAPENLTGEIKRFKPTHLLLIDSVDFRKKAGVVGLIDLKKEEGASFSTHKLPLMVMQNYLAKSLDCKTLVVGIQPESLEFSCSLSPRLEKSVSRVSQEIVKILKQICALE